MKLTVVIPFCETDYLLAWSLLEWIKELGLHKQNKCLLVAANGIGSVKEVLSLACDIFNEETGIIQPPFKLKDESHPRGPNWMFETTLKHMASTKADKPWLWLEPDCVPMRKGWLKEIEADYLKGMHQGYPIMANVTELGDPKFPARIPSGVAVYPSNALGFYKTMQLSRDRAWDIAFADAVIGKVFHTTKIWTVMNRKRPPIFAHPLREWMAKNVVGLERVKHAAIVHPSKDGSLIKLLRDQPKPIAHVNNGTPLFPRPKNPSLAVIAYLPPSTVPGSKAFAENVRRFETKSPLILYSDTDESADIRIPNPETCDSQYIKMAVNNCVFLYGLKIAIQQRVDYMLYLEADCRVNGNGWDGILFDEFLANPKALMGGSPVIRNIAEGSETERSNANKLSVQFTQLTKIPMAFQSGDNSGFMLHPNGAIGIYSTKLLAEIFPDYQAPLKVAHEYIAWDMHIGKAVTDRGYDAFGMFQILTKSYSGWKDQVLDSRDRKALMTKRGFVAIHQVKSDWQPA